MNNYNQGVSDVEEAGGLKNDFGFNNNVAGATRQIRLGKTFV